MQQQGMLGMSQFGSEAAVNGLQDRLPRILAGQRFEILDLQRGFKLLIREADQLPQRRFLVRRLPPVSVGGECPIEVRFDLRQQFFLGKERRTSVLE